MILTTIMLLAMAAQTPPPASPEPFVRDLYQREKHPTKADEAAFSGHRGAEAIYSPALLALIRKDINDAKGEEGKLGIDPICICQDSLGSSLEKLQLTPHAPNRSDANVSLLFQGKEQIILTLHLLLTPAGWRVDDISSPDMPSLRKFLSTN